MNKIDLLYYSIMSLGSWVYEELKGYCSVQ